MSEDKNMGEQANEAPKDGSLEAKVQEEEKKSSSAADLPDLPEEPQDKEPNEPDTVPLATFLELKKDMKELKKEVEGASSKSQEKKVAIEGIDDLRRKYPDVNEDFISDMLSSATAEATKKIEAKYEPIIQRQEAEKKQAAFDRAFDKLYNETVEANPDLPKSIDKDAIKALAISPQYRNTPLSELLQKMYGGVVQEGKSSSETAMRASADRVEDIVSFDNITPEQKNLIMKDDKVRKKYFDWLDKQN